MTPGCKPRAPDALLFTRAGIPRRDAGLQTSRSRCQSAWQSARKMSRKPPLGLPHQQRIRKASEETVRVGLKGCALDQTCASWCSRFLP